jgi:hypothetical protein
VPVANEVPDLKPKDVKLGPVRTTEERQKKNYSNGRMKIIRRKLKNLQVNSAPVYIFEQAVNT